MPDGQRIRLFREGVPSHDGRVLSNTTWEEPIPASLRLTGMIIGTVDQIRRDDEGWVTGVVHTDRDVVGLASEVSVSQATMLREDETVTIVAARLREVALGDKPVWDGMEIYPDLDNDVEHIIEASLMDWYQPSASNHRRFLATELQRVRGLPRDEISALIKNAYYSARDNGGTMHTAGDVAADAVLALIRGESNG